MGPGNQGRGVSGVMSTIRPKGSCSQRAAKSHRVHHSRSQVSGRESQAASAAAGNIMFTLPRSQPGSSGGPKRAEHKAVCIAGSLGQNS